jgi:UDP-glucose 4-epimerase
MTCSTSPIEFVPYERAYEPGFEDMPRRVPDLRKIGRTIGYTPSIDLDTMLRRIVEATKLDLASSSIAAAV